MKLNPKPLNEQSEEQIIQELKQINQAMGFDIFPKEFIKKQKERLGDPIDNCWLKFMTPEERETFNSL